MMDALLGVILQFSVLMLVSAAAGGVIGWLIGSRRRRAESPIVHDRDNQADARGQQPVTDEPSGPSSAPDETHPHGDAADSVSATSPTMADATVSPVAEPANPASSDTPEDGDADPQTLLAEIAELRSELDRKDMELMRLETGATSAWDTTVPDLQNRIDELRSDNDRLIGELRQARNQLDSLFAELDRARVSQARPLLPEDPGEGGA